ncbi:YjcZ family sporulation protein [Bacillus sp. UMB0893]|nr:YjcZ family sporulation protein [Bacillus sp. UMB0893]PLR66176.1 sporulation protein YjcZ [Bacillus sp. UMB0893]
MSDDCGRKDNNGFALIVVLFILLIIVGATFVGGSYGGYGGGYC